MFRPRFSSKQVDHGWSSLLRTMETVAQSDNTVKAGVLEASAARTGSELTNIEIALIQEFGSPTQGIPERSFVRAAMEANRGEYMAMLRRFAPQLYQQTITVEQVLKALGARMVADMKGRITAGDLPPDALETVAEKGSARPLIDTRQLLNSIMWELE